MTRYDALLIDADIGNLYSVYKALKFLGYEIKITSDPSDLQSGNRIVLPGVGAFGSFMDGLHTRGLTSALQNAARRGDPLLGICVGMQALFEFGEEKGSHPGLGLLAGKVAHFPSFANQPEIKIPHTGWNQLWFQEDAALFIDLRANSYAYFNHSYFCQPAKADVITAETDHGLRFASAVQRENIFGVQFHPEKSQRVGQTILKNFFEQT